MIESLGCHKADLELFRLSIPNLKSKMLPNPKAFECQRDATSGKPHPRVMGPRQNTGALKILYTITLHLGV